MINSPTPIEDIINTKLVIVETPLIPIMNMKLLKPIINAISAANSIKILSYQFKAIPSCFLVFPMPFIIRGINPTINIIITGISNTKF